MSYTRHHTIIITGLNENALNEAYKAARSIFKYVSPITPTVTNGYRSFFIPPDGSGEGWPESRAGDEARIKLVSWLKDFGHVEWVEVQFGDEENDNKVTDSS